MTKNCLKSNEVKKENKEKRKVRECSVVQTRELTEDFHTILSDRSMTTIVASHQFCITGVANIHVAPGNVQKELDSC